MFCSWALDKSKPIKPNITEGNVRYILVSVHSAMSDVSVDKQEFVFGNAFQLGSCTLQVSLHPKTFLKTSGKY